MSSKAAATCHLPIPGLAYFCCDTHAALSRYIPENDLYTVMLTSHQLHYIFNVYTCRICHRHEENIQCTQQEEGHFYCILSYSFSPSLHLILPPAFMLAQQGLRKITLSYLLIIIKVKFHVNGYMALQQQRSLCEHTHTQVSSSSATHLKKIKKQKQ